MEIFQTPTFSSKNVLFSAFQNKFCTRNVLFHNVSLRFVGNSSSECLQNVAQFFHHRETYQTSTSSNCILCRQNKSEGDGKYIDFHIPKLYRILHATKVDMKCLVVHKNHPQHKLHLPVAKQQRNEKRLVHKFHHFQ